MIKGNYKKRIKGLSVKVIKWLIRISFYFLLTILFLVILLYLPPVQQFITGRVEKYIINKTQTSFQIDAIRLNLKGQLLVRKIYLEDLKKDTLFYADKILVDVSIPKLLTRTLEISELELSGLHSTLFINPENNSSNFNFLVQAFSSPNKKEADTVSRSSWKIKFRDLFFEDIRIDLRIEEQMMLKVALGELLLEARRNDLDQMLFDNDQIRMANTDIDLKMIGKNDPDGELRDTADIMPLIVKATKLSLENIRFFINYDERIRLLVNVDEFAARNNLLDLGENKISNGLLSLSNSTMELLFTDSAPSDKDTLSDHRRIPWPLADFEWDIASHQIDLDHLSLFIHNQSIPDSTVLLTNQHLELSDLNFQAEDLVLNKQQFRTRINQFRFREEKGFRLNTLTADLSADPQHLNIRDLKLKTGESKIQATLETDTRLFTDPSSIHENDPFLFRIDELLIRQRTLDYLIPENPMKRFHLDSLDIRLAADGSLSRINLEEFFLKINQNTHFLSIGSLEKILDQDRFLFNIRFKEFYTTSKNLIKIFPEIDSFRTYLPEELMASGNLKGSIKDLKVQVDLQTTRGDLGIGASYREGKINEMDTIGLALRIDQYDLRGFFGKDSLRYISMDGEAGISGLKNRNLKAAVDWDISSLAFSDTIFHDIELRGYYDPAKADLRLISHDPALGLKLVATETVEDSIMNFNFSAGISGIDLKNLGITRNPLILRTGLNMNGRLVHKDIEGQFKIDSIVLDGSENVIIDEMLTDFLVGTDSTYINLRSDNITTMFSSNLSPAEIPERLKQFMIGSVRTSDSVETSGTGKINLDIRFKEPLEKFSEVFPDFEIVYLDHINLEFDETNEYLTAEIGIPVFDYRGIKLDSLNMNLFLDRSDFNYRVDVRELAVSSLDIANLTLLGTRKDTLLANQFIKRDSLGTETYFFEIDLTTSAEYEFFMYLNPERLLLDGNNWEVSEDSRIVIDRNQKKEGKIQISRGKQQVIFEILNDSLFTVAARQFDLHFLSDFLGGDQFEMGGMLDVESNLILKDSLSEIQAKVDISNFLLNGTDLGNIYADVRGSKQEGASLDIRLENQQNKLQATGYYHPGNPENPLLLNLNLDITSLGDFETLGNGKFTSLEGMVKGKARIGGQVKNFRIDGDLSLDQVGFFSEQLNNLYRIEQERIIVTNNQIQLKDFTITDSLNNKFAIDGYVNFQPKKDIGFDLHILADRFTIYNTSEKDNASLYGQMILTADAKATGTLANPKLNIKLTVDNGTNMTYVLPPKEINLVSYEEIVEFEVPDEMDSSGLVQEKSSLTDTIFSRFEGIDLQSNLVISPQAQFKLVIDPGSGDYVAVKGSGNLTLRYQEGSNAFISGVYTLSEGEYQVSFYGLVQKNFTIQEGSLITWTGDPDNARMNITASHVQRTSSSGLVAAETMGMTEDEMRQYRKALPYEVKIYITGTFQKPEFKFSIDLIDEDRAAYPLVISKLNRINSPGYESQLTQQVFGLLTIGSFIPEQTADSGTGYGAALATTAAANSLNGILTQELNKLSGKYLQGVDIDIGMQTSSQMTSGNSGTQTTMDVRFSKNFYNDRITIEAETSFDVGGDKYLDPTGYNYSNFQSDIAFKYDLTEKGDYKLKVFNKSSFDIIYKDIRTTGFAIIFVKDFDKISDIKKEKGKKGSTKQ